MVITYGTRYVGDVDKTPAGMYIATLFVHVMWIPLVPISAAVLQKGEPVLGVPLSLTSVLLGYLRTLLLCSPLLLRFGLDSTLPLWGTIPAALALYGLSHLFSYAGRTRAKAIEAAVDAQQW